LEPMGENGPQAVDKNTALGRCIEEAAYIFSGMIYGFSFDWTPSDNARAVDEKFSFEALGVLKRETKALDYRESRIQNALLYVRMRYFLPEYEQDRLRYLKLTG